MGGDREFRELLAADAALLLGVAEAPDVAAALQRYWTRRDQPGVTFESELAHIARLSPDALAKIRAEVERLLGEAGGNAQVALTRHGGLDRSIHLALGRGGANLTRALSVLGVPIRAPLRELPRDRYVGFEAAGVGGMGVVYAAVDTEMNRRVAFKMVRPHAESGREDQTPSHPLEATKPEKDTPESEVFEQLKARLVQEAWVTGGLEHPGIVPVYEIGKTPTGIPYYTMRYVRGERTLADAIREKKGAPFEERLALLEPFLKICDTLRYAHDKGVVHRDLKPANVALGNYGEVVLLDWGLARLAGKEDVASSAWQQQVEVMRHDAGFHTMEGGAIGTAGYMAPEAALGRLAEVDQRSDVYSLGAMLYEILTGRLCYQFRSYAEYASLLLRQDPPAAREVESSVPEALSALCARALAREKEKRPASAQELAGAVRAWQVQDAVEREVEALLRDAAQALDSAERLEGDARLSQVDRAAAALAQVQATRTGGRRAKQLAARAQGLRETGIRERERASTKRTLRRVGVLALAAAAVAAFVVVTIVEGKRKEAEDAKIQTAAALMDVRAMALAATSSTATDPMDGLILAREAQRLKPQMETDQAVRRALMRSLQRARFAGHQGPVTKVIVSGDGGRVITLSADRRARLWDAAGHVVAVLGGLSGSMQAGCFSADSTMAATGSSEGTATTWNRDGQSIATIDLSPGPVESVEFSPDGQLLLTTRADGLVALWDAHSGAARGRIALRAGTFVPRDAITNEAGAGSVITARFLPDGERILTTEPDGPAQVWSVDGTQLATIAGWQGGVAIVAADVSGDGSRFLTLDLMGALRIQSLDGTDAHMLAPPDPTTALAQRAPLRSAQFFEDRALILAASEHDVRVLNFKLEEVQVIDPSDTGFTCALSGPRGSILILGYEFVTVWRDQTEQCRVRLPAYVFDAALMPDARHVLAACGDGEAGLWAISNCEVGVTEPSRLGSGAFRALAFPADDTLIEVVGSELSEFDPSGATRSISRIQHGATQASFNSDASHIACTTYDGRSVVVVDRVGGLVASITEQDEILRQSLSPAGAYLLTWTQAPSSDDTPNPIRVRLWKLRTRESIEITSQPLQARHDVAWTRDGSRLVLGVDSEVRVVDLGGEVRSTFPVPGTVSRVWPSPLGTDVLVGCFDQGMLRLYDLHGKELAVLEGHEPDQGSQHGILDAIFCADGSHVATLGLDETIRIWTRDGRGRVVSRFDSVFVPPVGLSPDGGLLAVGASDGSTRLLDSYGKPLAVLEGSRVFPVDVRFSPSGKLLAVSASDGSVRTFVTNASDLARLADARITRSLAPDEISRHAVLLGDR